MQLIVAQAVSSATKSRFPLVAFAGTCFTAALLGQILSAQFGLFGLAGSILLIVTLLVLAMVAAASLALTWLRGSSAAADQALRSISKTGLGWTLIAASACAFYVVRWVNPSENILGGYDEGIYGITAANLARTGHYRLNAVLLPSLPAELRPWIIAQLPRMANRTEKPPPRYPCYHACLFVADEPMGTLISQFPVGFPALLGSAHALFGFYGQRLVNPILLFIAACLAGALITSWLGIFPGAAAFMLWLWFPLHAWAGNTRYAEVLLQALWLLALLGLAGRGRHPAWSGALAGLALGVSLAVKIDALPVALAAAVVVAVATGRRERVFFRTFLCALALSATISFAVLWQDNRSYVLDTLRSIAETNRQPLLSGAALFAAGSFAWALACRLGWQDKARASWPILRSWVGGGIIGGGLMLAAYAYFIRSHPKVPDTFYYWPQDRIIRSYREDTFLRLGWYWQPWGLGLVVLGMGAAVRHTKKIWQGLTVGTGLLFLIAFAYDIRNYPIEPYALRRFLPYATPLMVAGAAITSSWLPRAWFAMRAYLTLAITAALMLGFWPVNDRLNRHVEYAGLVNQATLLAERLPAKAVVLVSDSDPLTRLASCLEFVFDRPCLIVRRQPPMEGRGNALRRACTLWMEQGRAIYILSAKAGETLDIPGVATHPTYQGYIQTKVTIGSETKLVTEQTSMNLHYSLNEASLPSPAAPPAMPYHSP